MCCRTVKAKDEVPFKSLHSLKLFVFEHPSCVAPWSQNTKHAQCPEVGSCTIVCSHFDHSVCTVHQLRSSATSALDAPCNMSTGMCLAGLLSKRTLASIRGVGEASDARCRVATARSFASSHGRLMYACYMRSRGVHQGFRFLHFRDEGFFPQPQRITRSLKRMDMCCSCIVRASPLEEMSHHVIR